MQLNNLSFDDDDGEEVDILGRVISLDSRISKKMMEV